MAHISPSAHFILAQSKLIRQTKYWKHENTLGKHGKHMEKHENLFNCVSLLELNLLQQTAGNLSIRKKREENKFQFTLCA